MSDFSIDTTVFAEGLIEQRIDLAGATTHRVLNTAEAQIHHALVRLGWTPPAEREPDQPGYSAEERGERRALLEVRSFITKHGRAHVDAFCAQRLHDIAMDRRAIDAKVKSNGGDRPASSLDGKPRR